MKQSEREWDSWQRKMGEHSETIHEQENKEHENKKNEMKKKRKKYN